MFLHQGQSPRYLAYKRWNRAGLAAFTVSIAVAVYCFKELSLYAVGQFGLYCFLNAAMLGWLASGSLIVSTSILEEMKARPRKRLLRAIIYIMAGVVTIMGTVNAIILLSGDGGRNLPGWILVLTVFIVATQLHKIEILSRQRSLYHFGGLLKGETNTTELQLYHEAALLDIYDQQKNQGGERRRL